MYIGFTTIKCGKVREKTNDEHTTNEKRHPLNRDSAYIFVGYFIVREPVSLFHPEAAFAFYQLRSKLSERDSDFLAFRS
jgi:hypothetical protein